MADTIARAELTEPQADARAARVGRLVYRSWRRGFREADLVLGPFAEQRASELTDDELSDLEALLNRDDDHQIYAWITSASPTPAEYETRVMGKLRDFMREHVAQAVAEGAG